MTKRTFTVHSFDKDGKEKVEKFQMSNEMVKIADRMRASFEGQKAKCATGNFETCTYKNDTAYYEDGEHPECAKHCWVCRRCDAIIQIG